MDAGAGAARVKHDAVEDLAGVSRATEGRQGVPKPLGEVHSVPLRRRRCEERPDGQKMQRRHPETEDSRADAVYKPQTRPSTGRSITLKHPSGQIQPQYYYY